ncbi:PREDICTED: uncharacterized protein LOC105461896, partial [Wasmannia auropunctata]|uniref:uncharacterized protein LOC105461896 n=1 Tax=Wasmannia auropunctata TaxID=64793 RepID=UPI0005F029A9
MATTTTAISEPPWLFDRCSTFNKLIRVHGYILRFLNNCCSSKPKHKEGLSSKEIGEATQSLVKIIQLSAFPSKLKCLRNNQQLPRNSKLSSLIPFLDEQGILRVGGRLQYASLPYSSETSNGTTFKAFVHTIIDRTRAYQITLCRITDHISISTSKILATERKKCGLSYYKKVYQVFSRKSFGYSANYGQSAEAKSSSFMSFSNVGVDFCGPFQLRESKRRNAKTVKSYAAIFVCLATKAVEITFNLSSE